MLTGSYNMVVAGAELGQLANEHGHGQINIGEKEKPGNISTQLSKIPNVDEEVEALDRESGWQDGRKIG